MSDMRQKLLPVFLEEAARKILQLDAFLAVTESEKRTLEDLESAFRAAHTLKGTAALVQAEAVRSLAGRIEGLLEGHFELSRFPTEVECEAMLLALDRLKKLVAAVEQGAAEPSGIAAEAELALKLAMAMPGRKRLIELLEQQQLSDPFAEDPLIDSFADKVESVSAVAEDPFAEDPSFDAKPILSVPAGDPFAEDPSLEPESATGPAADSAGADYPKPDPSFEIPDLEGAAGTASVPVIDDPFGDDPHLEIPESEVAAPSATVPVPDDPFGDDPELEIPANPATDEGLAAESAGESCAEDPFAEDPELVVDSPDKFSPEPEQEESFAERMRRRIEKESALGTAERLASTLLLQKEDDVNERKFACCRFRAAEKEYYLPIADMVEIADLPDVIRLPLAPPIVRGLINLRGRVLPLIDLSVQAGTVSVYVPVQKIIVADAGGEQLAFLADGIPDLSEEIVGEKIDAKRFIEQFRAGES